MILQLATAGVATYLFWRSAYLSKLFSLRNRALVATDWVKVKIFGRCVCICLSSLPYLTHLPTATSPASKENRTPRSARRYAPQRSISVSPETPAFPLFFFARIHKHPEHVA